MYARIARILCQSETVFWHFAEDKPGVIIYFYTVAVNCQILNYIPQYGYNFRSHTTLQSVRICLLCLYTAFISALVLFARKLIIHIVIIEHSLATTHTLTHTNTFTQHSALEIRQFMYYTR